MEGAGNGKAGGLVEALTRILSSPVGGWALAVGIVGYMSWLTMQDRKLLYTDLQHLRDVVMPVITKGPEIAYENQRVLESLLALESESNRLLKDIREMVKIPSDNRSTLREIRDRLKELDEKVVPTITNDQP